MALLTNTPQAYYDGNDLGNYRFIALSDIISNFLVGYTGKERIIKKVKRSDIAFYAQRAIQELNYDTLTSVKTQEIEISPSLSIPLPHDCVNISKIVWVDDHGIEYLVLPNKLSSTPRPILQDDNYEYITDTNGNLTFANKSETEKRWQENSNQDNSYVDTNINFLEEGYGYNVDYGKRYGINTVNATKNGVYTIDEKMGIISFSGDFENRLIIIKYISDGLATDGDMIIHKFAEEAIYKTIMHSLLSVKENIPEYQINRYKKEKRAAIRSAKLRLSKLNLAEMTQLMRGKSKQIKH
jgi:hypothetical protein